MIDGVVNDRYEPVIMITLQGPQGQERSVEAVVDTGFSGDFTLTNALVAQLGLPYRGTGRTTLADGSMTSFSVFGVTVLWDGLPTNVEAEAAETTPLVGMRLLDGFRLCIDVHDGGPISIERRF